MSTELIEQQLADIQQKLNFISEEMQEYRARQRELQEFKNDFTLIAKDVFHAASEELEEVGNHFDTADILHLFKKLLRNVRNLNKMLDQMESAQDLFRDAGPLGKIVFDELLHKLDEIDKRGYFDFLHEAGKLVDQVVTSFSHEDVRLLRENVVSILLTVKTITQPEMLALTNNAVGFFKKMNADVRENVSFFELLKILRDPQTRRGIVFMLEFVRKMASSNGGTTQGHITSSNLLTKGE